MCYRFQSIVTFTTLGYGDILLGQQWRLLTAQSGINHKLAPEGVMKGGLMMLIPETRARLLILLGILITLIVFAQTALAQNGHNNRSPSPADCDAYARNYAERYSGGMLGGAAKGAIRGGIFGAIVGDSKAARRGAALGGVVGGTKRAVDRDQLRRRAYEDCMSGRVQW
jgi:hypothetical protein